MNFSFSAKRVNGSRAYHLARKGITVDLKPITVNIFELELINFASPYFSMRVKCSSGTYIRTLAKDIAESVGTCCHLEALERTKQGNFTLQNSVILNDSTTAQDFLEAMENVTLF
jgi:tRNA pseudouridine55 synthase